MNIIIPFSEACERNKDVILETVKPYLEKVTSVLEVGSGTAQHAIHFSQALTSLQWQASDQYEYLDGINAALNNAKSMGLRIDNVSFPIELNVNQPIWVENGPRFDAIYTANTFHIMSQSDVERFFSGLDLVTQIGSYLIVYGPFKYQGQFTSESNLNFDASLRSRGVGSAIRDFELINDLAQAQGFDLLKDYPMPANNQCVVWQRSVNR
ncbi:MAG: cyclopropane fatty-acyl-phospholipid synthase-like methyltransferase [Arenicella sp.]|jgi:cyclopropane fatty-acyl-phospholipid synthase-like methyltransferase